MRRCVQYGFAVICIDTSSATQATGLPQSALVSILTFTGIQSITAITTTCSTWAASLLPTDLNGPEGTNQVRECGRCFTINYEVDDHGFQECLTRMDPFKAAYAYLDFQNSCVASDCAAMLIRETRFSHTKREHRLLLASLSTRSLDIFCFPSITFANAYDQLEHRLMAQGEFLLGIATIPDLRTTISTRSMGTLVLHAPFYGTLYHRYMNQMERSPDWWMSQMKSVVERFPVDQSKYAFVVCNQRYIVWDGDFGRSTRRCCYCRNEKLISMVANYRQRGHLTDFLLPDPACFSHFACLRCAEQFTGSCATASTCPPNVPNKLTPARWPDGSAFDWTRSCLHGSCNKHCMPYRSSSACLVDIPFCFIPVQSTSTTCGGACCWSSPFVPAEYGDAKCGPPVAGHDGESLRDIRMLELKVYL
jgi:hypothetical protein